MYIDILRDATNVSSTLSRTSVHTRSSTFEWKVWEIVVTVARMYGFGTRVASAGTWLLRSVTIRRKTTFVMVEMHKRRYIHHFEETASGLDSIWQEYTEPS